MSALNRMNSKATLRESVSVLFHHFPLLMTISLTYSEQERLLLSLASERSFYVCVCLPLC